jgi:hypothetical protein
MGTPVIGPGGPGTPIITPPSGGGTPVIKPGQPALSSITVDALISMNTSTPGTALTTAIAGAGTESPVTPYFWDVVPAGFTVGAFRAGMANLGPVVVTGGATHTAGSLNFNNIAMANPTASLNYINNGPELAVNKITALLCVNLNIPQPGDTNAWDLLRIDSVDGQSAIINYNSERDLGSPRVLLEVNNNINSPNIVVLAIPGIYWFSLHLDMTTGISTLYVFDTSGHQVGSSMTATNSGVIGGDTINITRLGNSEIGTAPSGETDFGNIMFNWTTAPNPLMWS